MLITHDLRSVRLMADQIAVMYYGNIVEYGSAEKILKHPCHPYTIALASSVPGLLPETERIRLKGEPPSPINPPAGCSLHPRCPIAVESCQNTPQTLQNFGNNHWVRCSHSN
ncbi:ABC transporter ATP-binding protein [Marinifilum sp. JC120]|nr:ABC transporter ATP-binding protein [Marinifilum sp. JC120]